MNAITPTNPADASALTLAEAPPLADSLLNFVARAMADPAIDVHKLEMLLRMQREIVADDARLRFARAMAAAQGEMQPVVRSVPNNSTNSKYASLDAIDAAIRPIYSRAGFCLSFSEVPSDGPTVRIACTVKHAAGHAETHHLEAAADTAGPQGKANKTPVQGVGSTVSYLRRYLTCMVFNVALRGEDNDGNRQKPADAERINGRMTPAELKELDDLMKRTGTGEGKFLAFHNLDFRSIQQVPATEFGRLRNSLLTKVRVLTEREAFAAKARAAAARQPRDERVVGKMMDSWDDIQNGARS